MPIYEYKCPQCGKIKEILQSYDGKAPNCEICSGSDEEWKKRERSMDDWPDGEATQDEIDFLVSWVSRVKTVVAGKKPPSVVRMNRCISRTSFQLKGDGWAKDGYGGGGETDA